MKNIKIVNGVNIDQLLGTIEQIKENPEIAQFRFGAANTWIDGTHNRATVKDFYGALQEDTSRDPMVFEIDEPPVLCGQNLGANPVEYLLVALSGCLTTSLVAHSAARGIVIKAANLPGFVNYPIRAKLSGKVQIAGEVRAQHHAVHEQTDQVLDLRLCPSRDG